MLALRQRGVAAALVAVLLCAVAAELSHGPRLVTMAAGAHAAATQLRPAVALAACPVGCDADGDGLLDALLPIAAIVTVRLILRRPRLVRQPHMLAGRSIPPSPPPPRPGR